MKRILGLARMRRGFVHRIGVQRRGLHPRQKRQLVLTELMLVMEYASAAWECPATVRGKMEAIWNSVVRTAAGAHPTTSVEPLLIDLDLPTLEGRWLMYTVAMLRHILHTHGPYRQIIHDIYLVSRTQYTEAKERGECDLGRFWCHRAYEACQKLQWMDLWEGRIPVPEMNDQKDVLKAKLKAKTKTYMLHSTQQKMMTKPHLAKCLNCFPMHCFAGYWSAGRDARRLCAMLRAGALPLQSCSQHTKHI